MSNVIYHEFTPKKKRPTKANKCTGVFIKPSGADLASFHLQGNIGGFIASYVAFHPEFSPSLFGAQIRAEMGVDTNDNEPPSAA